jgi:predicted enzyme involved in methoxymalonyl-ACP biosynthesis
LKDQCLASEPADEGRTWDIDTWLMSCRVLRRGVEQAMLAKVVAEASRGGVATLLGTYIPTAKNSIVADHFAKLGFAPAGDGGRGGTRWFLALADAVLPTLSMPFDDKILATAPE